MSDTPTASTRRPAGDKGFTQASAPVLYIGDNADLRVYREQDGDLVVSVFDDTHLLVGHVRLTSDAGEAAFRTALAYVPAS